MNDVERAVSCFKSGFCCSQAIFSTYAPRFGVDRDTALKIATGFCGGMGRMGKTCGAVTGAFMLIGLKYGRTTIEDEEAKEKTYRLVREFAEKFTSRNGTIVCNDLLECDISTPEGHQLAEEKNIFDTLCPKLVQDAAEIVEEML